jgi:hypothetical protein
MLMRSAFTATPATTARVASTKRKRT